MSKELTLVEAWRALLDGEYVESSRYDAPIYRLNGSKIFYCDSQSRGQWAEVAGDGINSANQPFFIVPDPSIKERKSLSFEEALKSRCVKVNLPKGLIISAHTLKREAYWYPCDIAFFHTADQQGWLMEEGNESDFIEEVE